MVQIKNPVTIVQSGGGIAKPTSWAALTAMSTADLQQVFPAGSLIDTIECKWTSTSGSAVYDFPWQVANYDTCQLENDSTSYPCVTLLAKLALPNTMSFDAAELVAADSTTETTAIAGTYYYGISGTTYSALNLTAGDTIPYGDYTTIYKTDVTGNLTYFNQLGQSGYNNYKLSNIRQWLNSDGAAGVWFTSSHIGDVAPSYASQRGFLTGFTSDFLNVVASAKVTVFGNTVTDGGAEYTMYDKFFLPSCQEMRFAAAPNEGGQFSCIGDPADRCRSWLLQDMPNNNQADAWWLRSPKTGGAYYERCVGSNGASSYNGASGNGRVVPACKIILAS